ncbi:MAG: DUF1365 domain-containing protein [Opitutus sp.]
MNSCFYECQMLHARFVPRRHRFGYGIFLLSVDLDELSDLHHKLPLFSHNAPNVFSFYERDYFPSEEPVHQPGQNGVATNSLQSSATEPPMAASINPSLVELGGLKSRVLSYLKSHGLPADGGRVILVTLPRMFGYQFNPVSFYFCYDRAGTAIAAIAEVTNTFRETKLYLLGSDTLTAPAETSSLATSPAANSPTPATFQVRVPKHFYVSPFSDVDVAFDFTLRTPGDQLSVKIDDYTDGVRTFTSSVTGQHRPVSNARLASYLVKYPLLTLRVIMLIHWHAFRLWAKKVPWFAKAARASEQRDLYRPHGSLHPTHPQTPSRHRSIVPSSA